MKKIAFIVLGLICSLLLLEAGLRLGGFVFLSLQEYANRQAFRSKGVYRIMCVGESTTAGQYPPYLQKILDQAGEGIGFRVIDKGMVAANSASVVSHVLSDLDTYRPDMVIAMMGCNDAGTLYYKGIEEASSPLFRYCRAYRLARVMYAKLSERISEEIRFLSLRPDDEAAYYSLGLTYHKQGKFSQARAAFGKALAIDPRNVAAYVELGRVYCDWRKFSEAQKSLAQALAIDPRDSRAHFVLGRVYSIQRKPALAQSELLQAVALEPSNQKLYLALGAFYRNQEKFAQAQNAFKKALVLDPRNDQPYVELGALYLMQGKLDQAEALFKQALASGVESGSLYGLGSALYEERRKPELAKEYSRKADTLRPQGSYNPLTAEHYRRLKEALDKRGVRLACVQYPMRSIAPLKMIFEGQDQGIIFVDNEKLFRDAVQSDGYKAYFVDIFAGDFGHCTDKGNMLLAENIARAVLKEVRHK